tara:strand:+ start:728 stop:889 length:162 start_codon:yes stop_codon:yes gene_type:complete
MNSKKKQPKKDSYGRYVKNEDFSKYWEDEEALLDLSLKESKRQKKLREKKDDN